ncbi:hypothetical protein QE197_07635 [Arsenophonus nasoniae]|uniref:Conserved hypothetical phage protein n=2 Tax=Arsenophonus nasoniae TaxID=638 RepID=D2TXZ1_9GAMM|nr:hypothetical protein [Arsenophonus nasoniae]QBY43263.1 hypothetical protein ArsFIN_18300 [Arsenophonus nasoniae]WGM07277.1 hypothetical protein QE258_08485 [Arsenophonus nasoniae]WGM12154.1 hypothetical protein QE197_07635 [Arsenophonus nasoniae]WGM16836.1 hypothetical protein QE193_07535 [Arsenophonus nasoniae]CBA72271.1 conserved hypothetical phage protein [Arsenophonus nasoniae]
MIGLRITNPDGSFFLFNEFTAPATNIWTRAVSEDYGDILEPDGEWLSYKWTCPNAIPDGYNFYVMRHGAMAGITFTDIGGRMYVSGTEETFWHNQGSDGKVTLKGLSRLSGDGKFKNRIQIIAYPDYKKSSLPINLGLRIKGNAVFLNEIPTTGYAYAFYKKKITINAEFIPSMISPDLTIDNAIYFFYTLNSNAYIRTDYVQQSIYDPGRPVLISTEKNGRGNTSAEYYVVAFRLAKGGELDTGSHGLRLRNSKGEITFNSEYNVLTRPIMITGTSMSTGEKRTIENIRRPMYSPSAVGQFFFRTDGGYLENLNICHYDQTGLSLSRFRVMYNSAYYGDNTTARTKNSILVLDAEDYFKF